jgi:Pyruvate/2-oxoacid:ferredoxin oxidoreductase gamma subunit
VSAAALLGAGGLLSGLWATKRDDYPVTVMTGHSVSEVILSPREIFYTGIEQPDIYLALATEGMKTTRKQLASMTQAGTLYVRRDLLPVETNARTVCLNSERVSRSQVAIASIAAMLRQTNLYPIEALQEAIRTTQRPTIAEENLKAVEKSSNLICGA